VITPNELSSTVVFGNEVMYKKKSDGTNRTIRNIIQGVLLVRVQKN